RIDSSSSPRRVRPKRMSPASRRRRRTAPLQVASAVLLLAVVLVVSGCSYIEMLRRHQRLKAAFEKEPRLGLVQEFAPEQCLQIVGGLVTDPARDEPLAIIAVSQQYAPNEVVGWQMVPGAVGYYSVL